MSDKLTEHERQVLAEADRLERAAKAAYEVFKMLTVSSDPRSFNDGVTDYERACWTNITRAVLTAYGATE